jgi:hypothetical protein
MKIGDNQTHLVVVCCKAMLWRKRLEERIEEWMNLLQEEKSLLKRKLVSM